MEVKPLEQETAITETDSEEESDPKVSYSVDLGSKVVKSPNSVDPGTDPEVALTHCSVEKGSKVVKSLYSVDLGTDPEVALTHGSVDPGSKVVKSPCSVGKGSEGKGDSEQVYNLLGVVATVLNMLVMIVVYIYYSV